MNSVREKLGVGRWISDEVDGFSEISTICTGKRNDSASRLVAGDQSSPLHVIEEERLVACAVGVEGQRPTHIESPQVKAEFVNWVRADNVAGGIVLVRGIEVIARVEVVIAAEPPRPGM